MATVTSPPSYTVNPEIDLTKPDDITFVAPASFAPGSSKTLVDERFNESSALAELYSTKAQEYADDLSALITSFQGLTVSANSVDIPDLNITIPDMPTMSGAVNLDFPTIDTTTPTLADLPVVDIGDLLTDEPPDDIVAAISWAESAYDSPIFATLLARLLSDIQGGASGIGGTVEQDIYDRAIARQAIENAKKNTEITDYFSTRHFDLPQGAKAGRLQEQTNVETLVNLDLNGQILKEQADLAQANNQFVITASRELEVIISDLHNRSEDRNLDYSKAVAANAVSVYSELMRGYVARIEAKKISAEVQIENLKAVVSSNLALITQFSEVIKAQGISIEAISSANTAITDVYKTDIAAYTANVGALTDNQKGNIDSWELRIKNADLALRAEITTAQEATKGYVGEYGLRIEASKALTSVAMQAMSSAFSAVSVNAGYNYSGSESRNESYAHSESRSHTTSASGSISKTEANTYSHRESVVETHKFDES